MVFVTLGAALASWTVMVTLVAGAAVWTGALSHPTISHLPGDPGATANP
jgi:hypothetical protein